MTLYIFPSSAECGKIVKYLVEITSINWEDGRNQNPSVPWVLNHGNIPIVRGAKTADDGRMAIDQNRKGVEQLEREAFFHWALRSFKSSLPERQLSLRRCLTSN